MDNDLIFGNDTSDMLSGSAADDTQLAAAPSLLVPFDDALTRPFDAAQVVIPEGENIVRIPVAPGEVVELPFPADAQFLARIDNGNLAIKVGDVTVILQGYVEAAGQAAPVIEAANGEPIDIATILASTDPAIEIETAAGPAAGPQGQGADNTGAFFQLFGPGGGLGGFTGVGALDATDGLGGGTVDPSGTLLIPFGDTAALAAVNTAPTALDDKAVTNEDTKINGQVTATDPEGDALTYAAVGALPAGVVFNADGTWSFDPTGNYDAMQVGDTKAISFQYKANDGTSDSNVATVTIGITGVNDAPQVVAGLLGMTRTEDTPNVTQDVVFVVKDPDDTQFTVTVDSALPPGVSYNPATQKIALNTKGHYDYLNAGESEVFTITFKISDQHGGFTTRDVTLTIEGVNDKAVANADLVLTNNGTNTFNLPDWTLIANDTDKDAVKDLNVTSIAWMGADLDLGLNTDHIKVTDHLPLNAVFSYGAGGSGNVGVTVTNQAGGDIVGTVASEIIVGTAGAEKISAGDGNDIVVGNGGGDDIFGEGGDDTLVFAAGSKIHGNFDNVLVKDGLEGGAAFHGDVLSFTDLKLDFSDKASAAGIDGIETVSMQASAGGAGAQSLTIGAGSVEQLSNHTITPGGVFPEREAVRIDGDAVDQLYLSISKDGGNWIDTGVVSNGYHVYAHETIGGDPTSADAYVMVQTANVANVHLNADAP